MHQVAGAALASRCPVLCFLLAAWRRSGHLGGGEEKGSEGKTVVGWTDGEGVGEAPLLAAGRARRRRREREAQSGRGDGGAEERNAIGLRVDYWSW